MSPGALVLTNPLFVARIPTGAVVPEDPLTLARTLSSSRTAASCDLACLYLHCPATMYTSNRVKKPRNLHSPNTTEAPPTLTDHLHSFLGKNPLSYKVSPVVTSSPAVLYMKPVPPQHFHHEQLIREAN